MPNNDLQSQLGLGLAIKQGNQSTGINDYSYSFTDPSGQKGLSVSVDFPKEGQIFLGGGEAVAGDSKNTNVGGSSSSAQIGTFDAISPMSDTFTPTTTAPSVVNNPSTYSSGGLANSSNLLNISGTRAERVKTGKANYDSLVSKRNELMAADSKLGRYDAMKKARELLQGTTPMLSSAPVNSDPYGLNRPEAKTGIEPLDAELAKLRQDKADAIKNEFKSYSLAQADFNEKKGYYTNFDATNNTFNSVLSDVQGALSKSGAPQLSDIETQAIAQKYGITADEVKNPLSIYKKLEMTDEGKQVLGVADRENQIKDLQTDTERKRQDAITQHERNATALQQSIDDANREMQKNVDWATASGAWAGANRSSGYQQGIQNIKDDTARVVGRIQEQIQQSNADTTTYLSRLSEDLSTNMTRAKTSLDTDIKNLKFDTGLKLNGLEEKYGTNSKALLKALDAIQEEFGTKSMDSYNKYLSGIKSIQSIASENLSLIEKMNTVNDAMKNKRYSEIVNGGLLSNISLTNIADEVRAGKMDASKYADLKNLMTKTVVDTLGKSKTLTQADINTIGYLLDNGATPTQIVARLGGGSTASSGTLPSSFNGDTTSYIASKEGFRDTAYQDSAGVWTIGYGTTRINGQPIQPGQKISQTEAQRLLNEDIAKHSNWKNFIDESTLSPSQKTALASFEYNLGPGIWNKSAMNIINMVKSGDLQGAASEMQKYVYAGGNVIKGLQNRRLEESQLLLNTGNQNQSSTFTPFQTAAMDKYSKSGDPKDLKDANIDANTYNAYIASKGSGNNDKYNEAMALTAGLGGTEGERATLTQNIVDRATKKGISLIDAKKELGYKSVDDKNFEETRKQFITDMNKSYGEQTSNAKTALTLLNQPQTAIGDVASVVGFLKTIDPASVARESEVQAVENARGIIDSLSNVFAKAKEGTKLTDDQREQLKSAIQTIVDASDSKYNEFVNNTKSEFDARGLDVTVYIPKSKIEKAQNTSTNISTSQSTVDSIYDEIINL